MTIDPFFYKAFDIFFDNIQPCIISNIDEINCFVNEPGCNLLVGIFNKLQNTLSFSTNLNLDYKNQSIIVFFKKKPGYSVPQNTSFLCNYVDVLCFHGGLSPLKVSLVFEALLSSFDLNIELSIFDELEKIKRKINQVSQSIENPTSVEDEKPLQINLSVPPELASTIYKAQVFGLAYVSHELKSLAENSELVLQTANSLEEFLNEIELLLSVSFDSHKPVKSLHSEVSFWLKYEEALRRAQELVFSPEHNVLQSLLKANNKHNALLKFDFSNKLSENLKLAQSYALFLREVNGFDDGNAFNNDVFSDIPSFDIRLDAFFSSVFKIMNDDEFYGVLRVVTIINWMADKFLKALAKWIASQNILLCELGHFNKLISDFKLGYFSIENYLEEFQFLFSQSFPTIKQNPMTHSLLNPCKLNYSMILEIFEGLYFTRSNIDVLKSTLEILFWCNCITEEKSNEFLSLLNSLVRLFEDLNFTQISKDSLRDFKKTLGSLDESIYKLELKLIKSIKNYTHSCKSSPDVIYLFSQLNLFLNSHRPSVKNSMQDLMGNEVCNVFLEQIRMYQAQHSRLERLIENAIVSNNPYDVYRAVLLGHQFEQKTKAFKNSQANYLDYFSGLASSSPTSSSETESDQKTSLRNSNLSTLKFNNIISLWISIYGSLDFSFPLYEANICSETGGMCVKPNLSFNSFLYLHEFKILIQIHPQLPYPLVKLAKQIRRIYPFIQILINAIENFSFISSVNFLNNELYSLIVGPYIKQSVVLLKEGSELTWAGLVTHDKSHTMFCEDLYYSVVLLNDKYDLFLSFNTELEAKLSEILTCYYSFNSFQNIVDGIFKSFKSCFLEESLEQKQQQLNTHAIKIYITDAIVYCLFRRLSISLMQWTDLLKITSGVCEGTFPSFLKGIQPNVPFCISVVLVSNTSLKINYSIEYIREFLYSVINGILEMVGTIKLNHFNAALDYFHQNNLLWDYMTPLIDECSSLIDSKIEVLVKLINEWKAFEGFIKSLDEIKLEHSLFDSYKSFDYMVELEQKLTQLTQIKALYEKASTKNDDDDDQSMIHLGIIVLNVSKAFPEIQRQLNAHYKALNDFHALYFKNNLESFFQELTQWEHFYKDVPTFQFSYLSKEIFDVFFTCKLKKLIPSWEVQCKNLEKSLGCIQTLELHNDLARASFELCLTQIQALKSLYTLKNSTVENNMLNYKKSVEIADVKLKASFQACISKWDRISVYNIQTEVQTAISETEELIKAISEIFQSFEYFKTALEYFKMPVFSIGILNKISMDINQVMLFWKGLEEIRVIVDVFLNSGICSFTYQQIEERLSSFEDLLNGLPSIENSGLRNPLVKSWRKKLESYSVYLNLFRMLCSNVMEKRHWIKLSNSMTKAEIFSLESLTFGEFFDLDFELLRVSIEAVYGVAERELVVEGYIKEITGFLKAYKMNLDFDYGQTTNILMFKDFGELEQKLQEYLASFKSIKLDSLEPLLLRNMTYIQNQIKTLQSVLSNMALLQTQWAYLTSLFEKNLELRVYLKDGFEIWMSFDTQFRKLWLEFRSISSSSDQEEIVIKKEFPLYFLINRLPDLSQNLDQLVQISQRLYQLLNAFIKNQREICPRFYFLSDEDLIDLLENFKVIKKLQLYINKLFPGVSNLTLSDDSDVVYGFESGDGLDKLCFIFPIHLNNIKTFSELVAIFERCMKDSLKKALSNGFTQLCSILHELKDNTIGQAQSLIYESFCNLLVEWISGFSCQILLLCIRLWWTLTTEKWLCSDSSPPLFYIQTLIKALQQTYFEKAFISVSKYHNSLVEFQYMQRIWTHLESSQNKSFEWERILKYKFSEEKHLIVQIGQMSFAYSFEYTDSPKLYMKTLKTCDLFFTLLNTLSLGYGGLLFGPSGTGKTETVKCLGEHLGRSILVFCCDESFNFSCITRLMNGISLLGAWGCFDEFNRLTEEIQSSVSQQIQEIQRHLKTSTNNSLTTSLVVVGASGNSTPLNLIHSSTGIFITINPTYQGRHKIPVNLKKLFRWLALIEPELEYICQMFLFCKGFGNYRRLALETFNFLNLLKTRSSVQVHYDFGLRCLNNIMQSLESFSLGHSERSCQETPFDTYPLEKERVVCSLETNIAPCLVSVDVSVFYETMNEVFHIQKSPHLELALNNNLSRLLSKAWTLLCQSNSNLPTCGGVWFNKFIQFYNLLKIHQGIILVGSAGSGKSRTWKTFCKLYKELNEHGSVETFIISPNSLSLSELYGSLNPCTNKWKDGVFTSVLRKISCVKNEQKQPSVYLIVFDGEIDPEWAENLNSVLDDNKVLTLCNGERIKITSNVKILFEVQHLKSVTMATITRCSLIWYDDNTLDSTEHFKNLFTKTLSKTLLKSRALCGPSGDSEQSFLSFFHCKGIQAYNISKKSPEFKIMPLELKAQIKAFNSYLKFFLNCIIDSLVDTSSNNSNNNTGIVLFRKKHACNETKDLNYFIKVCISYSLYWAFIGNFNQTHKNHLEKSQLCSFLNLKYNINEYLINPWKLEYRPFKEILESGLYYDSSKIILTEDILAIQQLLLHSVAMNKSIILCGPPGCGKSMIVQSTLKSCPNIHFECVSLNSISNLQTIHGVLQKNCQLVKISSSRYKFVPKLNFDSRSDFPLPSPNINSEILALNQNKNSTLVVFLDEINLPQPNKYGSQAIISFLRQVLEYRGYWTLLADNTNAGVIAKDLPVWIDLERVFFIGACNPPSDIGRVLLNERFLRHCSVVSMSEPNEKALYKIYSVQIKALLNKFSELSRYSEAFIYSMIQFYTQYKDFFASLQQREGLYHHVVSLRDITRWTESLELYFNSLDNSSGETVKLMTVHLSFFIYEAKRLFQDKFKSQAHKAWTQHTLRIVLEKNFPEFFQENSEFDFDSQVYFCHFTNKPLSPITSGELYDFLKDKLLQYNLTQPPGKPISMNSFWIDYLARISQIFRKPKAHLLLFGAYGIGKRTTLAFLAWALDIALIEIQFSKAYSLEGFQEDLIKTLIRTGNPQNPEKITWVLDEENASQFGFLESLNNLLANNDEMSEVFEYLSNNSTTSSENTPVAEFYNESEKQAYIARIHANFHIVMILNDLGNNEALKKKSLVSPALFNRTIVSYVDAWPLESLKAFAHEKINSVDFSAEFSLFFNGLALFSTGDDNKEETQPQKYVEFSKLLTRVVDILVAIHLKMIETHPLYFTQRHFFDLCNTFVHCIKKKIIGLASYKKHLMLGIEKLQKALSETLSLKDEIKAKKGALELSSLQANDKLSVLLSEKHETEKEKAKSEAIQSLSLEKQAQLLAKSEFINAELEKVNILIAEALDSVKSISKAYLVEVRSLSNPPLLVRQTIYIVCLLIGQLKITQGNAREDWKALQSIIKKEEFISHILDFKIDPGFPVALKKKIFSELQNNDKLNVESVTRASKACGPLLQWALSQLNYLNILDSIGPLKEKTILLEGSLADIKAQQELTLKRISELETNISLYKNDYRSLIIGIDSMSKDIETQERKLTVSQGLLNDLENENCRWKHSLSALETNQDGLARFFSHGIFGSLFLNYFGILTCSQRTFAFEKTAKEALLKKDLVFSSDVQIISYLLELDTEQRNYRLLNLEDFITNSPSTLENYTLENLLILNSSQRPCVIIDPNEIFVDVLKPLFSLKSESEDSGSFEHAFLVITDMKDKNLFERALEDALVFGNVLLVKNVESYWNPIILPLLDQRFTYDEISNNRTITLQFYDSFGRAFHKTLKVSRHFRLFLSVFSLHRQERLLDNCALLLARCHFINFSVTFERTSNSAFDMLYNSYRPESFQKRFELCHSQKNLNNKLKALEKSLLVQLSNYQGQPLIENEGVLSMFSNINTDVKNIKNSLETLNSVMYEMNHSSLSVSLSQFSQKIARVFLFIVEDLSQVTPYYSFGMEFLWGILKAVLDSFNGGEWLEMAEKRFFECIAFEICNSLFVKHQWIFICKLILIKYSTCQRILAGMRELVQLFGETPNLIKETSFEKRLFMLRNNNQIGKDVFLGINYDHLISYLIKKEQETHKDRTPMPLPEFSILLEEKLNTPLDVEELAIFACVLYKLNFPKVSHSKLCSYLCQKLLFGGAEERAKFFQEPLSIKYLSSAILSAESEKKYLKRLHGIRTYLILSESGFDVSQALEGDFSQAQVFAIPLGSPNSIVLIKELFNRLSDKCLCHCKGQQQLEEPFSLSKKIVLLIKNGHLDKAFLETQLSLVLFEFSKKIRQYNPGCGHCDCLSRRFEELCIVITYELDQVLTITSVNSNSGRLSEYFLKNLNIWAIESPQEIQKIFLHYYNLLVERENCLRSNAFSYEEEENQLKITLVLLHAFIIYSDKMRITWTKKYHWTDADFSYSLECLQNSWKSVATTGTYQQSLEEKMKVLLLKNIYGTVLETPEDFNTLEILINMVFSLIHSLTEQGTIYGTLKDTPGLWIDALNENVLKKILEATLQGYPMANENTETKQELLDLILRD